MKGNRVIQFIVKYHFAVEFILLISVSLFFELAFKSRFELNLDTRYIIISQIPNILLLIVFMTIFRSNKKRYIAYMVFIILSLALFITDTCLFYYKGDLFSLNMLTEIGDGLKMGLKYNIFAAYPFVFWLLTFASLFLISFGLYRLIQVPHMRYQFTHKERFAYMFIILSLFLLANQINSLVIRSGDLGMINEKIYESPEDKRTFVMTFGINTYRAKDFVNTTYDLITKPIERNNSLITLEKDFQELTPIKSARHGYFEDKNLILILCETCEDYAIDPLLTPTLYHLLYGEHSYSFSNMYTSAKLDYTYDAEFKALTSMMYFKNDNYMRSFADNTFTNSLPSILRAKGYTANSFHSFSGSYFNRINMHKALGFENYYNGDDMIFSDYEYWPLDSEMIMQRKEQIAPLQDDPFFSFIITLTSHGSHHERRSELEPYYKLIEQDIRYRNYDDSFKTLMAAQMDLDKALKILIDHLKEQNILEDTVIVLFADHKNYSSFEITEKYTNLTKPNYIHEYDRIPYAIYNYGNNGYMINDLTSQYDITPTILDLFGISYYQEYYYGQSIFLKDTNEYLKKHNIIGYNRWISDDLILYEKDIIYASPYINNVEEYIFNQQVETYNTINKFHALFLTDYFKDNRSYVDLKKKS